MIALRAESHGPVIGVLIAIREIQANLRPIVPKLRAGRILCGTAPEFVYMRADRRTLRQTDGVPLSLLWCLSYAYRGLGWPDYVELVLESDEFEELQDADPIPFLTPVIERGP